MHPLRVPRNRARKTILVAVDGSPAAVAAADAGLEVATAMQATVKFIHAASPLAEDLYDAHPVQGPALEEILARDPVLAASYARAREVGVEAELEMLPEEHSADLAAAIAGIADGIEASMIVVGSRGLGSVAGAVLGSVSHNLIRYASVPVLVVHGPAAETGTPHRGLAHSGRDRAQAAG